MADIYGPTAAKMKLPNQVSDVASRLNNIRGLKKYDSNDALIAHNVAADLASGTKNNISKTTINMFGDVDGVKAVNTALSTRGNILFG